MEWVESESTLKCSVMVPSSSAKARTLVMARLTVSAAWAFSSEKRATFSVLCAISVLVFFWLRKAVEISATAATAEEVRSSIRAMADVVWLFPTPANQSFRQRIIQNECCHRANAVQSGYIYLMYFLAIALYMPSLFSLLRPTLKASHSSLLLKATR